MRRSLRGTVIVAACTGILVALFFVKASHGAIILLVLDALLTLSVVLAAVLFERYHYQPTVAHPERLRPTGERQVDPTTGVLLEVWEDPTTGQRDYRPVASENER